MIAAESPKTVALATPKRRLAAYLIDAVIIGVSLQHFLLLVIGIGWLVWFLIIAGRGQTPAKQLFSLRVVRDDGPVASRGWMLLREIVVKGAPGLSVFAGFWISWLFGVVILVFIVAALWCIWDVRRQCLWDKVVSTLVIHDTDRVVDSGGSVIIDGLTSRVVRDPVGGTAPAVRTQSSGAAQNLRTLAEMRDRGLLTDDEYEERRQRELERL